MNSDIIEANKRVHSSLILSGEYQKSPHRSLESIMRVRSILSSFPFQGNTVSHLDIGCGDGFIFECVPDNWNSHGVDATSEMLTACSKRHPKVKLKAGIAESLPYEDSCFDVVTCYSFLDHLNSTEDFYAEAMRVLKPGGLFYFGLSPNRSFYLALRESSKCSISEELETKVNLPLEFQKAFDDGTYYEKNFGIDREDLFQCEPGKSITLGLSPAEEYYKLEVAGALKIKITYEWILQQNKLSSDLVKTISNFLPFTSPCFKYFDLLGGK